MENNIILSDKLPLISEAEKQSFIETFIERMESGEHDVFEMFIQIKQLESMFTELVKHDRIKQILDNEFENQEKKFNRCGFVVEKASKSTYIYENDATICELKEKIKDREKLLKAIPLSGMADPETGEMLYPPLRKVTDYIKLTKKNNPGNYYPDQPTEANKPVVKTTIKTTQPVNTQSSIEYLYPPFDSKITSNPDA